MKITVAVMEPFLVRCVRRGVGNAGHGFQYQKDLQYFQNHKETTFI